jgi:hypothetical protein
VEVAARSAEAWDPSGAGLSFAAPDQAEAGGSTCATLPPRSRQAGRLSLRAGRRLDSSTPVHFLDERPARADWVLVGCERSRQIHEHLYGDRPPSREICPRLLAGSRTEPTLVKCCLLERGIERDGQVAVVPWGAELQEVEAALRDLVGPA